MVVLLSLLRITAAFGFTHGTVAGGPAPVVSAASPAASSTDTASATNGQAVATLTATNTPNAWAIASCSGCSGYFAIDNSGNVTVTSTGVSNITPSGAGVVYSLVVNASNVFGTSGNATIPITFYADGALSGPSCTTGSSYCHQQSNFFTGYTGNTYVSRPPWAVAGVDYPVGIHNSYSATLNDPSTTPPSGTTYASNTLTCVGNNVTIQGYDFSLHNGIRISAGSSCTGTLSVIDNYFSYGSAQSGNSTGLGFYGIPSSCTAATIFKYNVFISTHGGTGTQFTAFVDNNCTGSSVMEYNYFKDSTKDFIEYTGTSSLTLKYNYGQGMGESTGAHSQPYLSFGGATVGDNEAFNAFFADSVSTGIAALCEFNSSPAGTQTNPTCNNNTLVVTSSSGSYLVEPIAGTQGTFTVSGNYLDFKDIFGPYYGNPLGLTTISSGNVNMTNGDVCNAYASNAC